MKNRILKKKLLFLHHLETLDNTSLANQVYKSQLELNLPGLMDDCKDFLEKYDLFNIKPSYLPHPLIFSFYKLHQCFFILLSTVVKTRHY